MALTFRRTWLVDDVLTDPTSIVLSSADGTYGIRRTDTLALVVADGTAMTQVSTGVYEYTISSPVAGVTYEAQIEIVHDGTTYRFESEKTASSSDTEMTVGFNELRERLARFAFGARSISGLTDAEVDDIDACIKDGLQSVYLAHRWSFLRPRKPITTSAAYSTGTVTVASGVVTLASGTFPSWAASGLFSVGGNTYTVSTRDGDTQITLEDTSVTAAAGSTYSLGLTTYDLPTGFDAIEGALTFAAATEYLPEVNIVHEMEIRRRRQVNDDVGRPYLACIIMAEYDATVGSKRQIVFYPTPDDAYVLTGIMRLRPTMIDASNLYPLGGELLAPVIIEACLAAAEITFRDSEEIHNQKFERLLAAAIEEDKNAASPDSLGLTAEDDEARYRNLGVDVYIDNVLM